MDKLKGMGYNAAGIEHAFARFFNKPITQHGESYDSEIFQMGNVSDLGDNLSNFCDHLESRLVKHSFHPDEEIPGGSKAQLDSAIKQLRDLATKMQKSKDEEPYDYHWLIVGSLVSIIASLFNHVEGTGHGSG